MSRIIRDKMRKKGITAYKLSYLSGVPKATVSDICNGKAAVEKCSAGTLYRIAKVLKLTVEEIIEAEMAGERVPFDQFKENIRKHREAMNEGVFLLELAGDKSYIYTSSIEDIQLALRQWEENTMQK